jgi:hypothetical protein
VSSTPRRADRSTLACDPLTQLLWDHLDPPARTDHAQTADERYYGTAFFTSAIEPLLHDILTKYPTVPPPAAKAGRRKSTRPPAPPTAEGQS